MIRSLKVKLYPNREQEILMRKSCGTARYVYNWGLGMNKIAYELCGKNINVYTLKKLIKVSKSKGRMLSWISEVSADVVYQALLDLDKAYTTFYNNIKKGIPFADAGFPNFKKKSKSKWSFFHDNRKLKIKDKKVYLEKIGWVKMKDHKRLPIGDYKKDKIKVSNVRISYDNRNWLLTLGVDQEEQSLELTGESLGIDLGVKDLAICSNGMNFKNINKSKEVKRLEKKLKREQGKLSRKREDNMVDKVYYKTGDKKGQLKSFKYIRPLYECKNYQKQKEKVSLLHLKLSHIRENHLHQATIKIVKTKPSKIVLEDLNVKGMMKNKHLSKVIANQGWYEFRRLLEYKTKFYLGYEVTIADRFYPSSKTCSCCGHIKTDLRLKERTYICLDCGLTIDRDLNASINLANYKLA
ncbi:MAG: transposase [Clostridioides sp.]|jgi:putative transposase|nr:transposase [Clostridioides sp.]